MEINLQGAVSLPQSLPGARSADLPAVSKTEKPTTTTADTAAATRVPATSDTQVQTQTESVVDKRLEALQKAAESYFKNVYAVSDQEFTIYKDASGQYITRYTSLRDGKVTYIPEPDMLAYMDNRQQERQALIEIQA